jgi:hypothetical protein
VLGGLIFKPLLKLMPPPISLQHAVCLLIFSFSFFELLFYGFLFHFIIPLILWAWATIVGFFGVIDMIRGMELGLYERLGKDPVIARVRELKSHNDKGMHRMDNDAVFGEWENLRHPGDPETTRRMMDPYANLDTHLEAAGIAMPGRSPVGLPRYPDYENTNLSSDQLNQNYLASGQAPLIPLTSSIVRDPEAAHVQGFTPHATVHCQLLSDACRIGEKLFGKPNRVVTVSDVANFKQRWAPFIVSGHYTISWFRRAMAAHNYEKERWATREPSVLMKRYF